jgi:hypothetical protein
VAAEQQWRHDACGPGRPEPNRPLRDAEAGRGGRGVAPARPPPPLAAPCGRAPWSSAAGRWGAAGGARCSCAAPSGPPRGAKMRSEWVSHRSTRSIAACARGSTGVPGYLRWSGEGRKGGQVGGGARALSRPARCSPAPAPPAARARSPPHALFWHRRLTRTPRRAPAARSSLHRRAPSAPALRRPNPQVRPLSFHPTSLS